MNNTFGRLLQVTVFGESHGPYCGVVLDGLTPGLPVNLYTMQARLKARRPGVIGTTARVENDPIQIVSGVKNGKTTGTPVCILLPNEAAESDPIDYRITPRASHGDYPAYCRSDGYADLSGGGHYSGRLTAPLVAAGSILQDALSTKGIELYSHIASIGTIHDVPMVYDVDHFPTCRGNWFPVVDRSIQRQMTDLIRQTAATGDTLGGSVETFVTGLPIGVGEPWFDSPESVLGHALFSIPSVKGVWFGDKDLCEQQGSQAADCLTVDHNGIRVSSHHGGGVAGGLSDGGILCFTTAFKPVPTVSVPQNTVNLQTGQATVLREAARHDTCAVIRAWPVVEAVTALTLSDLLICRYGSGFFEV